MNILNGTFATSFQFCEINEWRKLGSCDGSVGRAFALNSRSPQFESSHRQFFKNIHLLSTVLKRFEYIKRGWEWRIFKMCGASDYIKTKEEREGRGVASDTLHPRFESSHRQFDLLSTVLNKLY